MSLPIALIVLVAVALLAGLLVTRRRPGPKPLPGAGSPAEVVARLRAQVLGLRAADAGITPPAEGLGVWGVVTDLGLARGSATVVALADGTASLYLSTGGGSIGGQGLAPVRAAAEALVRTAEQCASTLSPGDPQPLPQPGHVRFYVHTRDGLLVSPELSEVVLKVRARPHPLTPCFYGVHAVISRIREATPSGA